MTDKRQPVTNWIFATSGGRLFAALLQLLDLGAGFFEGEGKIKHIIFKNDQPEMLESVGRFLAAGNFEVQAVVLRFFDVEEIGPRTIRKFFGVEVLGWHCFVFPQATDSGKAGLRFSRTIS